MHSNGPGSTKGNEALKQLGPIMSQGGGEKGCHPEPSDPSWEPVFLMFAQPWESSVWHEFQFLHFMLWDKRH